MDKKNLILVFILCINTLSLSAQTYSFGEESGEQQKYFLGYTLRPGFQGPVQFAIIHKVSEDSITVDKIISERTFVYIAAGKLSSKANPKKTDYFKHFGIKDPNIVSELWKLRYQEYPYFTKEAPPKGWSTNDSIPTMPSPQQMQILKKFGIKKISDFVYGDNAFLLLQAIENDKWVETYKNSSFQ